MPHRRNYLDSVLRQDANLQPGGESSAAVPARLVLGKHCAYNRTRERFIGADVDAADFSAAGLDTRLPALAPNSGAGLWLIPFLGISPTSIRVPVDLVYLDRECIVIDTVESFPISRASSLTPASVLVLPTTTIRSTETRAGDQLILCPPDEMMQRLQQLVSAGAETKPEEAAAPVKDAPVRPGAGRILQWEDRARPKGTAETAPGLDRTGLDRTGLDRTGLDRTSLDRAIADRTFSDCTHEEPSSERERGIAELPAAGAAANAIPESATAQPALAGAAASAMARTAPEIPEPAAVEPTQKTIKPAKSWLQRLLSPDPPQPRKAQRESLPGLSAYFFTGGAPVAHGVRDISLTGMYVETQERWYPGTMVRMTLTDCHEPTAERSITLNTTVIRSDNEGVGLRFVLQNGRDRRTGRSDGMADSADKMQIEQFLQQLRPAKG